MNVGSLLESLASSDKDFRYMATSDLLNELQREGFRLEPDAERKLSQVLLKQLDDTSGDVSSLTVKCLGPLVKRVDPARVSEILEGLLERLSAKDATKRELGSIGLKSVIADAAGMSSSISAFAGMLGPKLVEAIEKPNTRPETETECLDVLNDLVATFGSHMVDLHARLQAALVAQLELGKALQRKRALAGLASLAAHMSDTLLSSMCATVIGTLTAPGSKGDKLKLYVHAVGALARSTGFRFGAHLPAAVPGVIAICNGAGEDEELREVCLQALEAFLARCPGEVGPFVEASLELALDNLSFDPNYAGDDDEADEMETEGGSDDDEGEDDYDDDGEEYSDDEDMSWKVRRASAKVISAAVGTRPDMLELFYAKASGKMIRRFSEREESVRLDVLAAFTDLLRTTAAVGARANSSAPAARLLQPYVDGVVKAAVRLLKEKASKPKVSIFTLLKELVHSLPEGLSAHLPALVPGIERVLSDKASSSNLKIEALSFLRLTLASVPPEVSAPNLPVLAPRVISATSDRYYKVVAESARVCSEMIRVMRPVPGGPIAMGAADFIPLLHAALMERLGATDQDQEVKEAVISCLGLEVATLGDQLGPQLQPCLQVLIDRLRKEVTRLTAVKAFTAVSHCAIPLDFAAMVDPVAMELTSFLRKANRSLRLASLIGLDSLAQKHAASIQPATVESMVTEAAALVTDADLHLASLALTLCTSTVLRAPASSAVVCVQVLPAALKLVQSSLLQGAALQSLASFFAASVASGAPQAAFDALQKQLLDSAGKPAQKGVSDMAIKHTSRSVAICVAALCGAAGVDKVKATVTSLAGMLQAGSMDDGSKLVALFCIGEIGKRQDLSFEQGLQQMLMDTLQTLGSEELKFATSFAIGSVAAGSRSQFLPPLFTAIGANSKYQYFLLHALKEVIVIPGEAEAVMSAPEVEQMLMLLFAHTGSEEEGARNVVAECLGRLVLVAPERVLPALRERLSDQSATVRSTVVSSIKYAIVDEPQPADALITEALQFFLQLISDEDRHVRRAAVQALNGAAHYKPTLVAGLLPGLLPLLYEQTAIRQDLIHVLDLGPFKHTVDDGLSLRKSAFECLDTLIDTSFELLDPSAYLSCILSGLADHADIKLTSHLVLLKLAAAPTAQPALMSFLERLVEPIDKTLATKLKKDAVKQEVDSLEDMLRSALRAVDALARLPDAHTSQRFADFLRKIQATEGLAQKYAAVRVADAAAAADGPEPMNLS
mmetsp:Transcript_31520/g.102698  ORF Transcript_31520/g.102698 Transcript_31520/m.102698 type:complete len:1240 (+) Transcript_31520:55-3774(+)